MKKNSWQKDLKNRQIQPSEETWNKISGQLHQKELASNRNKYLLWIAAACISGLLLYPFLFSTNDTGIKIVDIEENKVNPTQNSLETIVIENTKDTVLDVKAIKNKESIAIVSSDEEKIIKQTKSSINQEEKSDVYKDEVEHFLHLVASQSKNTNIAINENALLLLAEAENKVAPDAQIEVEINSLLAEVNKSINSASTQELEAFAQVQNLLEETENSLEKEDLKKRIWKFIKTNYENLETTLAGLK